MKFGDVVYVTYKNLFSEVNSSILVQGTEDGEEEEEEEIKKDITRLYGVDRYKTSLEIANEIYPKTENIVIASGYKSADALSAGPLANELNAPIILADGNDIDKDLVEYIENSESENIYIIGGNEAISDEFSNELEEETEIKANRINGDDRFETSFEVAKLLIEEYEYNSEIIIANGMLDADALASSTYATENKKPILLSTKDEIGEDILTGLKNLDINKADIIGGENTISKKIFKNTDIELGERISGENRYETSLKIAEKLENIETVVFANGDKSADALTAGPLANQKNGAILLTDGSKVIKSQKLFINDLDSLSVVYVVGGDDSMYSTFFKELKEILEEEIETEEKTETDKETESNKETEKEVEAEKKTETDEKTGNEEQTETKEELINKENTL